ncbi:DsbA family protein [Halobium salinum]|uniref:DsbA family protein n=1 Tax=Halobium salinum TaxID=1364940 RepID=A0ABD5P7T4_9EURY|nr:thioredoxin domain-containing protein [Halobium salinum]
MDTTRRSLLATVGGASTIGLAGCLGSLGGGGAGNCDPQEEPPVNSLPVPAMGDGDVMVKVWSDYACPHCRTFTVEALPKIEENYVASGDVTYEHHDFPIPVSEKWSWGAASAARGVQDSMDDEAFFEMSTLLFENQDKYTMKLVGDLAEQVGADRCAIVGDAQYDTYRPVLEQDRQRGVNRGVQGTPAIFVDGEQVDFSGAQSFYPPIEEAIENAL